MQGNDCPQPALDPGTETSGFRIGRITRIPEIRATAYEAIHPATGVQVLHLHCDDPENLYAVIFRTPPSDSTGVAHILEHSVLAGSEQYPVRDAFNELSKGTLKTFLNAFTAPDFTCYPVASQNRADFYNLAAVYTDLVFRPLLKRETFMQEGHHLEIGEDGSLAISGIVYNEMKGAYSTAEAMAERTTLQRLFPDTPYGVESGGHPDHIPDLTYEQFREFHRRYYSPSNARIFFYGDIPTEEHLRFLAGRLDGCSRVEVDSRVREQARWSAPRETAAFFPVGPEDPLGQKTIVNIAWLTAGVGDFEERLVLEVLQEALVGNAAAPLRKALIDSGLGQDLSPTTGLDTSYRQLPFIVGLRGTEPEKASQVEEIALSILERTARQGPPQELLEAAFHQVEFKGLEITRTPLPFPLNLLFRAVGTWLHEEDPLVPLRFPTMISGLRERWATEPDLFRKAVDRWLVRNPHRLRATIAPSRTLNAETEAKLRRRLQELSKRMSDGEREEVRRTAAMLLQTQREKEPPEALASLPVLRIEEIPPDVETIPTRQGRSAFVPLLEHDLFSNGIAYVDLAFDVSDVAEELQPLLPLLGAASTGMGAAGLGYEAFAARKALITGGISAELFVRERARDGMTDRVGLQPSPAPIQMLILRGRALLRNVAPMVGLLRDILVSGDLGDLARLRDIVAEQRNHLRAQVAPRGHVYSLRSAAAGLSVAGLRNEQWLGVEQLRHLVRLGARFESDQAAICGNLARLRAFVFRRGRVIVNLTGDADCLAALREPIAGLLAALPAGGEPGDPNVPHLTRSNPGVAIPGEVCYVTRAWPAPLYADPAAPSVLALSNHLAEGILYKKIRVEGGAYGGMAMYSPSLAYFGMASYRDPNLERTVQVYDECLDAFLEEELDGETLRKAIIGTISGLDRPMDPATRGYLALERHLTGVTDSDRLRFRRAVLKLTAEDLRRAVRKTLKPAGDRALQAVYGPRERIEAANRELKVRFEVTGLD